MDKIFCTEFQRYTLKFHTKYLAHTLKDMIFIQCWKFTNFQFYEIVCVFETPPLLLGPYVFRILHAWSIRKVENYRKHYVLIRFCLKISKIKSCYPFTGTMKNMASTTAGKLTTLSNIHRWVHYSDVIISAMASQITGVSVVYSTFSSGTDQRKHQSSASLAFVRVNSPHKRPVTRKCFHLMTSSCEWLIYNGTLIHEGHTAIFTDKCIIYTISENWYGELQYTDKRYTASPSNVTWRQIHLSGN